MSLDILIPDKKYKKLEKICNQLNIDINQYIKDLINDDLDNRVQLNNHYSFHLRLKVLTHKSIPITLTKNEVKLIEYLILNNDSRVSTEELSNHLKTDKFAMRNLIKNIRDKTYYDFFNSIRDEGYIINLNKTN